MTTQPAPIKVGDKSIYDCAEHVHAPGVKVGDYVMNAHEILHVRPSGQLWYICPRDFLPDLLTVLERQWELSRKLAAVDVPARDDLAQTQDYASIYGQY